MKQSKSQSRNNTAQGTTPSNNNAITKLVSGSKGTITNRPVTNDGKSLD